MSESKKGGALAKILGGVLMVAAVLGVIFIEWKPKVEEEPVVVRPLKTMVLGEESLKVENKYPAKAGAFQEVTMAFEVAGSVIEFPVNPSDEVTGPEFDDQGKPTKQGQLLARLDPRDYQNSLEVAEAELNRAKAHLDRIKIAIEKKAVSQQDLSDALAAFEVAQANVNISQKALDDTELRARFDGRIADQFVDNFENVQAKQPILSLQDISSVEIRAVLSESRVSRFRNKEKADRSTFHAEFDYFADQKFPLTFKEMVIEADPTTQTYLVTFVMASPTNLVILPGMTATIVEQVPLELGKDDRFLLPLDVVPVDDLGNYFVWLIKEGSGSGLSAQRQKVTVDTLMDTNRILVTEGLKRGDRIAMAGVYVLKEGQVVRLLESE